MEDKRNQRGAEAPHLSEPQTYRNPKRHISLVSLAVHPFIWALGLRLWSGSEAVRQ